MDAPSSSLLSDATSGPQAQNELVAQEDGPNEKTAKEKQLAASQIRLNTLPMLRILSIMRKVLPVDANIDADVDLVMRTCVANFTEHLTKVAKEQKTVTRHRILQAEDIISALSVLGFTDASTALSLFHTRLIGATNFSQPQVQPVHISKPTSTEMQQQGGVNDSTENPNIGSTDIQSPVQNTEYHQSPVHNSEPHQSPVEISEPYQSPVQNPEPQQSPVQISEPNQAQVYNYELHQSPVHNSEPLLTNMMQLKGGVAHQSPVHNPEPYQSLVQNPELQQSPVHNSESYQAQVHNYEPYQSPVHNSEPLLTKVMQLKGSVDVPTENALGTNEGLISPESSTGITGTSHAQSTEMQQPGSINLPTGTNVQLPVHSVDSLLSEMQWQDSFNVPTGDIFKHYEGNARMPPPPSPSFESLPSSYVQPLPVQPQQDRTLLDGVFPLMVQNPETTPYLVSMQPPSAPVQQDGSVEEGPLDVTKFLADAYSRMIGGSDTGFATQVPKQAEAPTVFNASPLTQPMNQPAFPWSTQFVSQQKNVGGDGTTMAVDEILGTKAGITSVDTGFAQHVPEQAEEPTVFNASPFTQPMNQPDFLWSTQLVSQQKNVGGDDTTMAVDEIPGTEAGITSVDTGFAQQVPEQAEAPTASLFTQPMDQPDFLWSTQLVSQQKNVGGAGTTMAVDGIPGTEAGITSVDTGFAQQVPEQAEAPTVFNASPFTLPMNQPAFSGSKQLVSQQQNVGVDGTTMTGDGIPGTEAGITSGVDFDEVMSDVDLAYAIELLKDYDVL